MVGLLVCRAVKMRLRLPPRVVQVKNIYLVLDLKKNGLTTCRSAYALPPAGPPLRRHSTQ